jgi:hypothetical protein
MSFRTPTDTPAFRNWFGQSVVTVDGRVGSKPLVVYHGSRHSGFRAFTKKDAHHVGHFFTDDYSVAASYTSGSDENALMPFFRSVKEANAYAEENMLDFEIEIEKDFEYDIDGNPVEDRNVFLVRAGNFIQGEFDNAWDALDYVNYELELDHSGIYEVYLRIEEPMVVDAQGENWDRIPYEVDGEIEKVTTNWLSYEALDMGADGVIIHNVVDSGGYGGEHPATVFIVFSPTQIKSVENRGTWDPRDEIITNPRKRRR